MRDKQGVLRQVGEADCRGSVQKHPLKPVRHILEIRRALAHERVFHAREHLCVHIVYRRDCPLRALAFFEYRGLDFFAHLHIL